MLLPRSNAFLLGTKSSKVKHILLALNWVLPSENLLSKLWKNATIKVAADGGSTRLNPFPKRVWKLRTPDIVVGDMDSVVSGSQLEKRLKKKGTEFVEDPNQDTNDMQKAVDLIFERFIKDQPDQAFEIDVVGAFGGRIDQEMCNLSVALRFENKMAKLGRSNVQMKLWSDHACATFLGPGEHEVLRTPEIEQRKGVGLIPFGCACEGITTRGLKWDLHEDKLCCEGLVSSSNEFVAHRVDVKTSNPLLWTWTLDPGFVHGKQWACSIM